EVVPTPLRVIDLERVAVDRDLQLLAGDLAHLDASGRLVVPDHVDLAADQTDLELAHHLEVDRLRLARHHEPAFLCHVGSLLSLSSGSRARDGQRLPNRGCHALSMSMEKP